MRRRLRKKKRLGEFRELGFSVTAVLAPDADYDALIDRLIDAVEARGLGFGGGGRPDDFGGFVTRPGRKSTTDEDREALGRFFGSDPAITNHEIGALVDAWYPPESI